MAELTQASRIIGLLKFKIQNSNVKIQNENAKCKMQNAKCKMQNAKCKMLKCKMRRYGENGRQNGRIDLTGRTPEKFFC